MMKMNHILALLVAAVVLALGWFSVSQTLVKGPYFAHVWLRVASSRPKIIFDTDQEQNYRNDRETQAILIRSSIVLKAALQHPGIKQLSCLKDKADQTAWLADNLEVGFLGESEILQIAISGRNPDELIEILKAVRAAYMDQVVAVDRDTDVRRRMTLESAYKNLDKQIARKRIQVKNLWEQLGGEPNTSITSYANGFYKPLSVETLWDQVTQIRVEMMGLNRKMKILTARLELVSKTNPEPEIAASNEENAESQPVSNDEKSLTTEAEKLCEEIEILSSDRAVLQEELEIVILAYKQEVVKAEQLKGSNDLDNLRAELARMQKMHQEMGAKLEEWTVESQAAARVQPINEPEVRKVGLW